MRDNSSYTSRHWRLLMIVAALLGAALLVAACGSGGQEEPAAQAPAAEAPAAEAPVAEPTVPSTEEAAPEPAAPPAEQPAAEPTAPPSEEPAVEPTSVPAEEPVAAETEPDPVDPLLFSMPIELAVAATQGPSGRVIAPAGVNIRSGPGASYPIVGVAREGAEGEIVGKSEDGQWWVANVPFAPDGQGWIASAYVEASGADDVSVIPTPPVPATPAAAPVPADMPSAAIVETPDELPADSVILFSASRRLLEGNRAYELEDIYAVSPQPGSSAQLIIPNAMQPSLQHGGNILAFRSTQPDQFGLSAYDFGADGRVRYSNSLEDSTPRWNPTGDRLLFSSNRTGDRRWHVYIQDPRPSDDRSGFPEVIDLGFGKDADWHPSSDVIVFKGCDDSGQNCGLWTINADGSNRSRLTDGFNDSLPRWSPDGTSIVFMSDSRDGAWELYSLSVTDGAVRRLTENQALDGLPVWSPNGQQIAFMSNRDGAWGIWTMSAAGGDAQLITQLEEQLPDWLLQGLDWPR